MVPGLPRALSRAIKRSFAVAVVMCAALVLSAQAVSSPSGIDVVLYGKSSNQIQFVVCVDGANPGDDRVVLTPGDLEISWLVRDAQGTVIGSGPSAPAPRYLEMPTCAYGYPAAYDVRDLTAGTTYLIEAEGTLRSPPSSPVTFSDTLSVTTTGGCPLTVPAESPPRYTYLHAIIDDQNVVTAVHSIAPGTTTQPPWSSTRYVATYYGWPGKQYAGIGYLYDPATENFAPPLPAGEPMPEADLLGLAEVSGCPGDDVDLVIAPESRDNCDTVDGGIQGFAPGACAVQMTITRPSGLTTHRVGAYATRTITATVMVRGFAARPTRPGGTTAPPSGAGTIEGLPAQAKGISPARRPQAATRCSGLPSVARATCLARARTATALKACQAKPKGERRTSCMAAARKAGAADLRKAKCLRLPKALRAACLKRP